MDTVLKFLSRHTSISYHATLRHKHKIWDPCIPPTALGLVVVPVVDGTIYRLYCYSISKEPNIILIRGGTPYLFHCDATYVAPPAGGNAVDVLSVDHSISYAYGRAYGVVEE